MAYEILFVFLVCLVFVFFANVVLPVSAAIDDYFSKKAAELRAARKRR